MNKAEICIHWDAYLNNVSKGFSWLQQNAEFVDMTLAAEGHLVKVHQNIVALASPYLKAMLQSASCQHPVIFLNNINHKTLGYILEYIYTGEVKIPSDIIDTFIAACKSLCIRGVDGIESSMVTTGNVIEPQVKRVEKTPENSFAAHITINKDNNYDLELISSQNNDICQRNAALVPAPNTDNNSAPMESEISRGLVNDHATACKKEIDINNIHNFIILQPKPVHNNIEMSTDNTENSIKILSDEIIHNGVQSSNGLLTKLNEDVRDNETVPFGTNTWHTEPDQRNANLDVSDNAILHPADLISLQGFEAELNQNIPTHEKPTDIVQKSILNKVKVSVKKRPKNLLSYVRIANSREDQAKITLNKLSRIEMDKTAHYSISNRGSLQLILNRYLYHSHHQSNSGKKIRWRCIDYRKMHCPAYIDTDNEETTAMSENHCHPNHDIQIRKKIKNNIIFTSYATATETIKSYSKENPRQ